MKRTLDKDVYIGEGIWLCPHGEQGFMLTHLNGEGFPRDPVYLSLAEALTLRYALEQYISTPSFE